MFSPFYKTFDHGHELKQAPLGQKRGCELTDIAHFMWLYINHMVEDLYYHKRCNYHIFAALQLNM